MSPPLPDSSSGASSPKPLFPSEAVEAEFEVIGTDVPASETSATAKAEGKDLFGDKERNEELKRVFHWAFLNLVRVAAVVFLTIFVIRALHFILPENNSANAGHRWPPHGWLTDTQLQNLDKFFFSGALGAFAVKYLGAVLPSSSSPAK